ncbi:MAG: AmmeMemoRadiSam system protein A [Deltaproteobacteria bacterium]|nr:AmmeMemoRadiSam system protein A [Deltaproteobacteria bacterium]
MPLTDSEKKALLDIARSSIESHLLDKGIEIQANSPALLDKRGAFVSLHKWGHLRGCIGSFTSDIPLYKTVSDMAIAAATQDPRFMPVDYEEMKSISLEISVLSPLKETDPSDIEVGRHGIYIIKGRNRGVLLPQVATEHGFDRVRFLEETCLKAGLEPDDWKRGATILTFEAEIFLEPK